MAASTQEVYVIRHGETEWSRSGQHTGVTDIPLTERGRAVARRLRPILSRESFALVLTSPMSRARETCELAGLGARAEVEPDLMEWNYGEYEGLTHEQIRERSPAWMIFRDGCPGGETPAQIGARVDRLIARVRDTPGKVALFAHGHVFRVLVARWIGLAAGGGEHFFLDTGTVNVLGYYGGSPAVKVWNVPLARDEREVDVTRNLEDTAQALVAAGKGILAADETVHTLSERFAARGIDSTAESRRDYRELLISTPDLAKFISGVILYDETIRQADGHGTPLVQVLARAGIIPGIKVDTGARPLASCPGETVTEGLDGLRERLKEYRALGARFAKWRAVIHVSDPLPSGTCVEVNAHALGRYAALCQEEGLVPIVESEVLMNGAHSLARAEEVTGEVLRAVFRALLSQRVSLEGMLLKPNMVVPGAEAPEQASVAEVATATLRVLRRHVPAAVPGVVFLSGGQSEREATAQLNAMHTAGPLPWRLSFSFGRALQDPALAAWGGRATGVQAGQQALYHRARCNGAASVGKYDESMEMAVPEAEVTLH